MNLFIVAVDAHAFFLHIPAIARMACARSLPSATCQTFFSCYNEGKWNNDFRDAPPLTKTELDRHFGDVAAGFCDRQRSRGWNFKVEYFIRNVMWREAEAGIYLRSTCVPSMKSGHYKQLALLESGSATVLAAYCECPPG